MGTGGVLTHIHDRVGQPATHTTSRAAADAHTNRCAWRCIDAFVALMATKQVNAPPPAHWVQLNPQNLERQQTQALNSCHRLSYGAGPPASLHAAMHGHGRMRTDVDSACHKRQWQGNLHGRNKWMMQPPGLWCKACAWYMVRAITHWDHPLCCWGPLAGALAPIPLSSNTQTNTSWDPAQGPLSHPPL